jgi:hypothetical protein
VARGKGPYAPISVWCAAARRSSGCAEQRESRESSARASCRAGRRRTSVFVLPRPSVVNQRLVKRKRPTWHLAQAGRVTAPFPVMDSSSLLRLASTVGTCTFPAHFLTRLVSQRVLPAFVRDRHDVPMISVAVLFDSCSAPDAGAHVASELARGRAPARGMRAEARVPCAVDSGGRVLRHWSRFLGVCHG